MLNLGFMLYVPGPGTSSSWGAFR